MNGRFYRLTRDLHLYAGLFISPFVLVFSVTVFFLVHAWLPRMFSESSPTRMVKRMVLPADWQKLSGRALVDAVRPMLAQAGVPGEVGFVRHQVKEEKLIVPVMVPGRETTVTIDISSGEGTIESRKTGLAAALVALHKSPGPHGPTIRMNWFYMRVWQWMADSTVYLLLFVSVSGIYLWYVLRAERRVGFIMLLAGILTFFGMAYAVSH